jgi:hypothetical protein
MRPPLDSDKAFNAAGPRTYLEGSESFLGTIISRILRICAPDHVNDALCLPGWSAGIMEVMDCP